MAKRKKSFPARHVRGWTGAGIFVVLWIVAVNVYTTFRASFEAGIAASQVNDSVVQYSLVQKMIYGDLATGIIHLVFLVLVVLCLLPTAKELFKGIN